MTAVIAIERLNTSEIHHAYMGRSKSKTCHHCEQLGPFQEDYELENEHH